MEGQNTAFPPFRRSWKSPQDSRYRSGPRPVQGCGLFWVGRRFRMEIDTLGIGLSVLTTTYGRTAESDPC